MIRAETEERPRYFNFTKQMFLGWHPTMPNLNYDPFPDAEMDDIVRTEIIGRELFLEATIQGDDGLLGPGMAVRHEGRDFAIISAETNFGTGITKIEASVFLQLNEPVAILTKLREIYSTKNTPV